MLYRYNDSDLILPSPQFPSLVMREDDYPVEYYVRRLLRNPKEGKALLKYTGNIYYLDDSLKRGEDNTLEGDNTTGEFFDAVMEQYRRYAEGIDAEPVREGQVIADYRLSDDTCLTDILASRGQLFIHTEQVPLLRMRKEDEGQEKTVATLDDRALSDGNPAHTFVCPFGTGRDAKVRVSSSYEAYDLYRKCINGELQIPQWLGRWSKSNGVPYDKSLASTLTEQFDWIRKELSASRMTAREFIRRQQDHLLGLETVDRGEDIEVGYKSDAEFKTFVCPFGTGKNSRVKVDSCAEASYLYEKALRGELDWESLMRDLQHRGNITLNRSDVNTLIAGLKAQFDWMRDEISSNETLADMTIVAESLVPTDSSMGRSIYDPVYAPSPAHILAHYINNPVILNEKGENTVTRALSNQDTGELRRFVISGESKTRVVNILVDGSDTIGGRVPGTGASIGQKKIFKVNRYGKKSLAKVEQQYRFQNKDEDTVNAEYADFSSRMDSILEGITGKDSKTKVRFITGNGYGVPKFVRRYVEEREGHTYSWSYSRGAAYEEMSTANNGKDGRFEVVMFPKAEQMLPVFLGTVRAWTTNLKDGDDESVITLTRDMLIDKELLPHGCIAFTDSADTRKKDLYYSRASLMEGSGLPCIHVMDNQTDNEQSLKLMTDKMSFLSGLDVEQSYVGSLLDNSQKTEWSRSPKDDGSHFLYVRHDVGVTVGNYSFRSLLSVGAALMIKSSEVKDKDAKLKELSVLDARSGRYEILDVFALMQECKVSDSVQERCMRNAARLMSRYSETFRNSLFRTGEQDISVRDPYSYMYPQGSNMSVSGFNEDNFVDVNGSGRNLWGLVLMQERAVLNEEVELDRKRDDELEARLREKENRSRSKMKRRARIERVEGGLPATREEASEGIWFLGTSRPAQLELPEDEVSVCVWENGVDDELTREMATRETLNSTEGERIPNEFVFIFPTNQYVESGKGTHSFNWLSNDLTDCVRKNPATGENFVCAFGLPVKRNRGTDELSNDTGAPCSYLLDNQSSVLLNDVISTDAKARSTALAQGMMLAYPKRYSAFTREQKSEFSKHFEDTIYGIVRYDADEYEGEGANRRIVHHKGDPVMESKGRVYNKETRTYDEKIRIKKGWIRNPHRAPKNRAIVNRYETMLDKGEKYPLNCIVMPKDSYTVEEADKFLADFSFCLSLANENAKALNIPLCFPLNAEGKVDFGPGVPAELAVMARNKLDAFQGIIHKEDLEQGLLTLRRSLMPYPVSSMEKYDGSEIYLRPNDILRVFGDWYEQKGEAIPFYVHEMSFLSHEGTKFLLVDYRLARTLDTAELNRWMSYSKNEELRFKIYSNRLEDIPAFKASLQSYIEAAKGMNVEYQLVSREELEKMEVPESMLKAMESCRNELQERLKELNAEEEQSLKPLLEELEAKKGELRKSVPEEKLRVLEIQLENEYKPQIQAVRSECGQKRNAVMSLYNSKLRDIQDKIDEMLSPSQKGYVCMLSSNADEEDYQVGNEHLLTARPLSDGVNSPNRFDGTSEEGVYYGKVDANDGFEGYVRYRYTLPGCEEFSAWKTLPDLEFAKDVVLSMTNRMYCSDTRVVPSDAVIRSKFTALAVADAQREGKLGIAGRTERPEVVKEVKETKEEDKKQVAVADSAFSLAFTVSKGGYATRTDENANAADVDFTIAFAVDFDTPGEKCTARCAGKSLIPCPLPVKDGRLDMSDESVKAMVNTICRYLPDDMLEGEAMGLNIAGNGIVSLEKKGVSQEDLNSFFNRIGEEMKKSGLNVTSFRSGGQTGVDEAGVYMAAGYGAPMVVHAPRNWEFRNKDGKDIYGEADFKKRFDCFSKNIVRSKKPFRPDF